MKTIGRNKRSVCCFLIISATVASLAPVAANDQKPPVNEELASHAYAIPGDLLETVYKPDYSHVPNPNPNWSHEPVIRLLVQWPDFGPAPETKSSEIISRRIHISLSSLEEHAIMPLDRIVVSLEKHGRNPEVTAGENGLQELRSDLTKDFREYIAPLEGDTRVLIHCRDPSDPNERDRFYPCNIRLPWKNLNVDVYFNSSLLPYWKEIFSKTEELIETMRTN